MANYHRTFCGAIENLSNGESAWCNAELTERRRRDETVTNRNADSLGDGNGADFQWSIEAGETSTCLYLWSDDSGSVRDIACFVQGFLRRFRHRQSWWLTWADVGSKPEVHAFGGGAVFVTVAAIDFYDVGRWVEHKEDALAQKRARRQPRRMSSYRAGDFSRIREASLILRQARDLLVAGGASKAAEKVRRALKSAEGAERFVSYRRNRHKWLQEQLRPTMVARQE